MERMKIIDEEFITLDSTKRLGRPIAILGDLQGPKIRIGTFQNSSVTLRDNQKFCLDLSPKPGNINRVFLYRNF